MEISGGSGYPDDEQWLVHQSWYPGGYAPAPGLQSLMSIGSVGGLVASGFVDYALVLVYSAALVAGALGALEPDDVVLGHERMGIAIGFCDGDIWMLGELAQHGMAPVKCGWV